MSKPGFFIDVDGTYFRWQLFDVWIHEMVYQGLLPQIVLTRADAERKAYKFRKGEFSEFIKKIVHAYQGNQRLRGILVEDARIAARECLKKQGQKLHEFVSILASLSRELGYVRAIVSGSPDVVIQEFAMQLEIEAYLGTNLPHKDGRFTGEKAIEWYHCKDEAVRKLASEHDIDLSCSIAIGDSEGDIAMMELVRYPICFNPNDALETVAYERGWPIVKEKKTVTLQGRLPSYDRPVALLFEEILPEHLAATVKAELLQRNEYVLW